MDDFLFRIFEWEYGWEFGIKGWKELRLIIQLSGWGLNLHGFYPRQAFHSHKKAVNRQYFFKKFLEFNILIKQSENLRDRIDIESDYFYNLILVVQAFIDSISCEYLQQIYKYFLYNPGGYHNKKSSRLPFSGCMLLPEYSLKY